MTSPAKPLLWPKIALACVTLFVLMCVIFMIREVNRVKRIRDASTEMRTSAPQTSPPPPAPTGRR